MVILENYDAHVNLLERCRDGELSGEIAIEAIISLLAKITEPRLCVIAEIIRTTILYYFRASKQELAVKNNGPTVSQRGSGYRPSVLQIVLTRPVSGKGTYHYISIPHIQFLCFFSCFPTH